MVYTLSLLLLFILPFQFALPGLFGWEMPLVRLLAAVIITLFLITVLFRKSWQLPQPVLSGALVSFLGIVLASLLWAAEPKLALPKILFLFNLMPLVFVWHDLLQRDQHRRVSLAQALVFGALGAGLSGIVIFFSQFIFGASQVFHFMVNRVLPFFLGQELGGVVAHYPSLLVNIDGQTILRATAFFPDPHVAAFFFGMCGFLALGLARREGKWAYGFAAGVLFLADILSFSRGGYIGLVAGALTYAALAAPNLSPRLILRFGGGVIVVALTLTLFGQSVISRFATSFSASDTSSTERIVLWREAAIAISQHPVIGVGIGNYLSSARPLYQVGTPFYAHNLYLDTAVEVGIIGVVTLLLVFLSTFWRPLKMYANDSFIPALASALAMYMAHSFFETALFSLHVTIVLMFILALASSFRSREAW